MLVRFTVKNYLSFKEEVIFSMIPGRAQKHPEHIIRDEHWDGINLLRVGAIYGANAAGKSNLVRAMHFARDLIIHGTEPRRKILVNHHKLSKACLEIPSKFQFEFKYDGKFYAYGFELDQSQIYSEWLYRIGKTNQKMIFERETKGDRVTVEFGDVDLADSKEEQFLHFVARGTRPNQLFLTESIDRNVKHFEKAFTWFAKVLTIVFPDSRFVGLEINISREDELSNTLLRYLQLFDTGVSGIELVPIDFKAELSNLPDAIRDELLSDLTPDKIISVRGPENQRYVLDMDQNQELQASKLMTRHKIEGCDEEALLEIKDEADGTQRLMDLIPALFELLNREKVFIIDELDRSLHPILSYRLLEHFLSNKPKNPSQLIVTTHESNLLDLGLLRRDEIWFIERDPDGASAVYSLEEFAPRYDKNIRKGYLLGRFGAIPMIGDVSDLGWVRVT